MEPLDEQEQEQIIQSLMEESREQMELIHSIFSRVCEAAIFLCLVVGVTTTPDVWCWVHVIGASVVHWGAIQVVASSKIIMSNDSNSSRSKAATLQKYLPLLVVFTMAIYVLRNNSFSPNNTVARNRLGDDTSHHLGLIVSNVVTMGGAFYLKWDNQRTKQALEELIKSKYQYKSL